MSGWTVRNELQKQIADNSMPVQYLHGVVFTHWSSINFFTVCVSEAVAHVELVEFGLKGNLKFYNFGHVESYV